MDLPELECGVLVSKDRRDFTEAFPPATSDVSSCLRFARSGRYAIIESDDD